MTRLSVGPTKQILRRGGATALVFSGPFSYEKPFGPLLADSVSSSSAMCAIHNSKSTIFIATRLLELCKPYISKFSTMVYTARRHVAPPDASNWRSELKV